MVLFKLKRRSRWPRSSYSRTASRWAAWLQQWIAKAPNINGLEGNIKTGNLRFSHGISHHHGAFRFQFPQQNQSTKRTACSWTFFPGAGLMNGFLQDWILDITLNFGQKLLIIFIRGVPKSSGYPHLWMVYFMENTLYKMDDFGYPYFRKPPYIICIIYCYNYNDLTLQRHNGNYFWDWGPHLQIALSQVCELLQHCRPFFGPPRSILNLPSWWFLDL